MKKLQEKAFQLSVWVLALTLPLWLLVIWAARLEGQTKSYGVKLIVGPQTAESIGNVYQVVELDLIAVKGKTEPARIYTVLDVADPAGELLHKKFLELYRQGNWDAALNLTKDLKRCWNDELDAYSKMMEERIQDLKFEEPWDWDGIYRATSK